MSFCHIFRLSRMWDIAQVLPREHLRAQDKAERYLKIMRVVTYILLFLLVLCTAILSQGSLLMLTSVLAKVSEDLKSVSLWI